MSEKVTFSNSTGFSALIFPEFSIVRISVIALSLFIFSCSKKNSLIADQELKVEEFIQSEDQRFKLTLQGDGNLVVSDENNKALWASNTAGKPVTKCVMQGDGNLVLYDNANKPYWASGTEKFPGSKVLLDDEGYLSVYFKNRPVWVNGDLVPQPGHGYLAANKELKTNQTITSNNLKYRLVMQEDGNLVLSDEKNATVWSTNTSGKPVTKCVFQGDGNLVLYNEANQAQWASDTYDYGGAKLILDDDGYLTLYHKGRPVWINGQHIKLPGQPEAAKIQ